VRASLNARSHSTVLSCSIVPRNLSLNPDTSPAALAHRPPGAG